MNYLHDHPHASRVLLASLAALALLVVMSAAAAAQPITSDQFAPGWESHARPLINMGISRFGARDRYYLPRILPRGDYVLVRRTADGKAEVIDGYRFQIRGDDAEQYIFLTPGSGEVEAIPIDDVPGLKARLGPAPLF
jgi:hypothetical protein